MTNFKNHDLIQFDFKEKVTCFYGKNGIGKTNILDAIHYLSFFKNINHLPDSQLIKDGKDFFRLDMTTKDDSTTTIKFQHRKKSIEKNDLQIKKISSIFGHIPIVLSSPQDLFFLYNGSEDRRKFLDFTISIYDKKYMEHLTQYQKIIDQRTAHLKQETGFDIELIDYYNQKMVIHGTYIFEQRKLLCHNLSKYIQKWCHYLSDQGDPVQFEYQSKLLTQDFMQLLQTNLEKDKLLHRTTQGIHRDEIECRLKDVDIKKIGSQGQQKTFLYALKIAQAEYLNSVTGSKIIFLLDDFSDKLDSQRHHLLQELIYTIDFVSQWFITDTDRHCFDSIKKKQLIEVL